jgi:polar amino acid transport system substrate-binding protein
MSPSSLFAPDRQSVRVPFLKRFFSKHAFWAAAALVLCSTFSFAQSMTSIASQFAPTGTLRAAINVGNPILAQRDPASQQVTGVSVDLAGELARRLGVGLTLVVFDAAGKSVDAVTNAQADVGFFAVDPVRGQGIAFTAPYVLIEGSYLVRQDSPLQRNEDVDRPGVRVAVGKGSAYDLYLTREIKQAQLHRAPTSPTTVDYFLNQQLDVAAGVKQQLQFDAGRLPQLRLLPGRFMVIEQAMGLPRGQSPQAQAYLRQFVEDMKASGFVAAALQKHKIEGASIAPAQSAP